MYIGFRLGNSVMILVVYIALIPSIKMRNHEKKTLGLETEWKKKKKNLSFPIFPYDLHFKHGEKSCVQLSKGLSKILDGFRCLKNLCISYEASFPYP